MAPHAMTMALQRTLTRWPRRVRASTPTALPDSTRARSARVSTKNRAPASCASASHVFTADCFAPMVQPNPQ